MLACFKREWLELEENGGWGEYRRGLSFLVIDRPISCGVWGGFRWPVSGVDTGREELSLNWS